LVDVVTSSRCLLALYTKLRAGVCLTHVGREGRRQIRVAHEAAIEDDHSAIIAGGPVAARVV
jgi:hypothetical protein